MTEENFGEQQLNEILDELDEPAPTRKPQVYKGDLKEFREKFGAFPKSLSLSIQRQENLT